MPTMCWRRELDIPSGGMPTIVASLSELSERDRPWPVRPGLTGESLDYTAAIEVFDVIATGRVLVVWTATFPVPDGRLATAEMVGRAVFRDFIGQLRDELLVDANLGVSA